MSQALSHAERTYITDGLALNPPQRLDFRKLDQFRNIEIEAPASLQADGSARVRIGTTEVLCGIKAEIESQVPSRVNVSDSHASIEYSPWLPPTPRVQCSVEMSPALLQKYGTHEQGVLTQSLNQIMSSCFVHNGSRIGPFSAGQFVVLPNARYWQLHVDVYVMSQSSGNLLDTLFAAVFAALWHTRLPRTQVLAYEAPEASQDMVDAEDDPLGMKYITRGRRTRAPGASANAVDYSIVDEYDDGVPLDGRDEIPVCITVFPISTGYLLDASLEEEAALQTSVSVITSASGRLYGIHQRGDKGLEPVALHAATQVAAQHAKQLAETLKV